jgi:hypothetical protein
MPADLIQIRHAAKLKLVMMFAGMGPVVDFVGVGIQRAGGYFVKQRFPDVSQPGVHQRDPRFAFFAKLVSQPGNQFKATGAAADNHDMMQVFHNGQFLFIKRAG